MRFYVCGQTPNDLAKLEGWSLSPGWKLPFSHARDFFVIDLLDPALHASGEIMRVFRELAPVQWTIGRRGPGYWSVTGHPELVEAARNVEVFSSHWGTRPEVSRPDGVRRPLHNLDGIEHGALRAIAARIVDPERLAALDPVIETLVEAAVSGLSRDGSRERVVTEERVREAEATTFVTTRGDARRVDMVAIAEHVVSHAFASWLGFRASPETLLARVVDVHAAGAALLDTARDDAKKWAARAGDAKHASEAIATLVDDELAHAAEGTILHELRGATEHAAGLAALFLEAGMPTAIDAIASAVVDLARHPMPIDDVAALTEELLRRASPIAQFARRATRDIEFGGQRIVAGQQIVLWFAAANHDPRVFPDPEALRLRSPNPHVAFGVGPHRCVGVAIGRRLVRAVVTALRAKRVELHGTPVRRASSYLRGYVTAEIEIARL